MFRVFLYLGFGKRRHILKALFERAFFVWSHTHIYTYRVHHATFAYLAPKERPLEEREREKDFEEEEEGRE